MKNVSKIIALLGMVAMLFAMVGCSTGNSPDENGPGTEINPDIYLYNSALSINLFGDYEQWWEGPSVTDSSDAEKTGMHVVWTNKAGSCGYSLSTAMPYTNGTKITIDVWTADEFDIKLVSTGGEVVKNVVASVPGTWEKITVEHTYTATDSFKQIGFVGVASESTEAYVDNIKLIYPVTE